MFTVEELTRITKGILIKKIENIPIEGISIDSRTIKPYQAFVAIKGNNFDGHNFIGEAIKKGASCIIAEVINDNLKQVRVNIIQVKNTPKALADISHWQRMRFSIPLIAITGSNGKTTTKEMVSWILSEKYSLLKNEGTQNNHIGLPLTLLRLTPQDQIVVLELGTNHFGEISYLAKICQPTIGIITNIGPAHLQYLGSLQGVFKEKSSLIKYLNKPKVLIINADDSFLRRHRNRKDIFVISIGIKNCADFMAKRINFKNDHWEFFVKKHKFILNSLGYHNIYNALFGICVARLFGLGYSEIAERIKSFVFISGRLNLVKIKGTNFIDDTYNANPGSLKEALNALKIKKIKGRKILIIADMLELGSKEKVYHSQIGKLIRGVCDIFISIGELAKFTSLTALKYGFDPNKIFICKDIAEARKILFDKIKPNDKDLILVKGSRRMHTENIIYL